MACVAQAADGHAVKVHWLHKVAQQCSLQAQNVPSEDELKTRESGTECNISIKCRGGGEWSVRRRKEREKWQNKC